MLTDSQAAPVELAPLEQRARPARYALLMVMVILLAEIALGVMQGVHFRTLAPDLPLDDEAVTSSAMLWRTGALALHLAGMLACIILFCRWFYRAAANARLLGADLSSPAMTVGHFFIPFANIYLPYQSMREILFRSEPEEMVRPSSPGLLWQWWACWIGGNMLDRFSDRIETRAATVQDLALANWCWVACLALLTVAAWLLTRVIEEVTVRQEARRGR